MSGAAGQLAALPVVDIAPWLNEHNTHGRLSASAALHAACLEFGFFYLDVSSYIDPSEPEELTRHAREFFSLSQAEKDKIGLRNQDGTRGYQRLKENVTNGQADNHEGIDFYRPVDTPDKSKPLWGENQWPDIPGFRERYETWIEKMKKLGMVVMEAMASGLGMSAEEWEELRAQVDDSFWVMRIIGYPPLSNNQDGFSCGAHKDYGCLTFLYQDSTKQALQVFLPKPELLTSGVSNYSVGVSTDSIPMYKEGLQQGVWINADPVPGCVVCNIGEMWEIWTNGLYKATLHRVIHRGSNYRVSIPFFYEPNFDARIAPLPAALRIISDSISLPHAGSKNITPLNGPHRRPGPSPTGLQRAVSEAIIAGSGGQLKPHPGVVYGEFLLKKVGSNFDLSESIDGEVKKRDRY